MKIPRNYAIALTAALGLFMAVLDNTVVNVALTPIGTKLGADLNSLQWVITGYFLAQAAVIPAAGYFSNRFGIKRVYILCLIFFTIGSLLCGLATSIEMLIIFRLLQGLGGGALFPLGQSLAFAAFPPEKRAASSSIIAIPVLLAPAFGPTVGGLLTESFGWEYIFFVNVPFGFLAVFLAWRVFPADNLDKAKKQVGFDYLGLSLSILGVLAVVYAFTLVSETRPGTATALNPRGDINGWGYWLVWTILGLGIALLVAFAVYALRFSKDPVVDLRLFKNYNFAVSSVVSWLAAVVVFGSLFMLPVFLEQVRSPHLNALQAGLALMPQGLAAAVAVAFGGRFYNKIGVRWLVVIGSVFLIISSWQLAQLKTDTDGLWLMPWLILRGFGFGLTAIPVQTLALQAIVGPALPKASSLFNVMRQIASSIGIAALTTMFVQQTNSHFNEARAASGAGANREQIFAQAGTMGMNDVFIFVTIGCIVLLLLAFALPGANRKSEATVTGNETKTDRKEQPALAME